MTDFAYDDIAKMIDHSLLNPTLTDEDLEAYQSRQGKHPLALWLWLGGLGLLAHGLLLQLGHPLQHFAELPDLLAVTCPVAVALGLTA